MKTQNRNSKHMLVVSDFFTSPSLCDSAAINQSHLLKTLLTLITTTHQLFLFYHYELENHTCVVKILIISALQDGSTLLKSSSSLVAVGSAGGSSGLLLSSVGSLLTFSDVC